MEMHKQQQAEIIRRLREAQALIDTAVKQLRTVRYSAPLPVSLGDIATQIESVIEHVCQAEVIAAPRLCDLACECFS